MKKIKKNFYNISFKKGIDKKINVITPIIDSVMVLIFILLNSFLNNDKIKYKTNPALKPM